MKTAPNSGPEPHQNSPADSRVPAAAKKTARSRLTNGSQTFLERLDGRGVLARRWRDLYWDFLAQTGGKNETLVRTLTSLCVQRDAIDVRLARGEPVETADLIRVAGAISRLMTKLGLVADADADNEPLPADAPEWMLGRRAAPEEAA